ncbi:hypothetical protein [Gilvibacter sp.]|uniref:hypothetical protein n=1 Tax=Gilvibacter sp. TaxID=2729997 RepID=UPI003F49B55A
MNKTLLNKVLIGALVLIWVSVGYKLLKPGQEPVVTSSKPQAVVVAQTEDTRQAFEWEPLVRDPFLNTISKAKKTNETTAKKPLGRPPTRPKQTSTIWPTIEYFGYVQKERQSAPLALIKINGVLQRLRAGEAFQSIAIKAVYQDSIAVQFGSENKVFRK